jgi:zinc protease
VPNNATLVLVGDFDTARRWRSSAVPRPRPEGEAPVPRDIPKEPPQTGSAASRVEEPWPLPAVVVAHHITYDGHPDSYPLHIASKVLSDGQSSRIYRKLVYEKQLALAAFGGGNIIEHPNLFYAVAIVQPGSRPRRSSDALIAELERLKPRADQRRELQRRRTSSRATTSSAASRTSRRPRTWRTPSCSTTTSRRPTASSTSS